MAERRMFAKSIIDSDVFLDMPLSTQALYFHLSMRADDEGFINNPKKIMRMIGASQNELEILLAKRYLLIFDSGVVVIKHWRIHNYIQKDRFKETLYKEEKSEIMIKENKSYTEIKINGFSHENTLIANKTPESVQDGYIMDTESVQDGDTGKVSIELGKSKLSKDYKEKNNKKENSDFSSFPGSSFKSLSGRISEAISHWNQKGNLPPCKHTVITLPQIGDVKTNFNVYLGDEILNAIDNFSKVFDEIDPKFRPKSFHKFILVSLDNWLDSANPLEQYEKNKSEYTDEDKEFVRSLF